MVNDLVAMIVAALMTVPGSGITTDEAVPAMGHNVTVVTESTNAPGEFRGVWVTTVINLDWPSRPGISNAEMMREIDYIVEHSRSIGLNAIVLQVRPAGDAIYPSAIFPWSKYLTGEQGLAPANGFDPLAYWIERTHANGLELHAWINPYRVTHSTSRILDVNLLHPTNPARLRSDMVVPHGNALYLDPGFPEARQLIIDGIVELLQNYNLDGIHFDDYFYPGRDFNDSVSHAMYGMGMDRTQWRVNNVNALIYGVRQAINEINPGIRFGISPTGIWANEGTHPLGSATRGYQHYIELSADSRRWISEGWIDYIVPQIYWHIGFDIADYAILLRWWEDQVRGTDVDLYIGHAAWREHEGQANFGGEILRQMHMNEASDVVTGSVFFRWASLRGTVGETLRQWYAARPGEISSAVQTTREPVLLMDELMVVSPSGDVTVDLSAAGYSVFGSSIPNLPLFMNGDPITNRTPEGFFGIFAPLTDGENILEFTQPGHPPVVRRVRRTAPAPAPADPNAVPVAPPVSREYTRDEPYYATVTAEVAWLFPGATAIGGTNWMLERGMRDRIIASVRDGQWLQLSNGGWIEAEHVERERTGTLTENVLSGGNISQDGHITTVSWQFSGANPPAARVRFDEVEGIPQSQRFTIYLGMQTALPAIDAGNIAENSIFAEIQGGADGESAAYMVFNIREDVRVNAYDVRVSGNQLELVFMTPRPLYPSWREPFNGFTFVIDPGHGGSDYGALGPMGRLKSEKHVNLINSLLLAARLEALGAEVILVRDTNDNDYTLRERVMVSRGAGPDMFISMHANSVAETTDATNIRGFTVWYRNESSYHLARTIMNHLQFVNPGTNRWNNPNQANFYVCRPTWAPSILLETSFMPNIDDFAWMINPAYQHKLAEETVIALIAYYRQGA